MSSFTYSPGSSYTPAPLASVLAINGKNTGSTTVYTVPVGKTFFPQYFIIKLASISGGGLTPTLKFKNNTTSLDLMTAVTLTGLTTANYTYNVYTNIAGVTPGCAENDVIQMQITSGAGYTTYNIDVHVYGLLI